MPNSLELLEIKSGFLTAEEFKLTLSAPALKRSLIEETESIPPPTVNGIFTDFAVLETRSTNVFLFSTLALISKNTNSSAPSSEYLQANSTGSPESLKLTKFTPLTTLPWATSKQGIKRRATILVKIVQMLLILHNSFHFTSYG